MSQNEDPEAAVVLSPQKRATMKR